MGVWACATYISGYFTCSQSPGAATAVQGYTSCSQSPGAATAVQGYISAIFLHMPIDLTHVYMNTGVYPSTAAHSHAGLWALYAAPGLSGHGKYAGVYVLAPEKHWLYDKVFSPKPYWNKCISEQLISDPIKMCIVVCVPVEDFTSILVCQKVDSRTVCEGKFF